MTIFSTAQKPAPVTGVSGAGLLMPSLRPSCLFSLALQLTEPSGWWVSACVGNTLPYRGGRG